MIKFGEQLGITLIAVLTAAFYVALWLTPSQHLVLLGIFALIGYTLYFVVSRSNVRRLFWLIYIFVQLGLMGLFVILEWSSAMLLTILLAIGSAITITFWSRRVPAPIVFIREKPLRRAVSLVITVALFAYISLGHALLVFFPMPWIGSVIHPAVTVAAAFAAYLYWSLYFSPRDRAFVLPTAIVSLIMLEASIVARLTSFGYLAIGLCIAWIWYLLELFIRFHHDKRDIDWTHQSTLLVTNGVLFLIFIWIIRYV